MERKKGKEAESILAAAEQWKRRCLIGEGSVFTDRPLWTRSNFQELQAVFVKKPDSKSSGNFTKRLERQLRSVSSDAKCLWAEMTWVYFLIQKPRSILPETKRKQITTIWNWSGRDFPGGHELLNDSVLGAGILNLGSGKSHIWKELHFFVVAMDEWFSLDGNKRSSLLGRPWDFASWLDGTKLATSRMFRHVLLFLLFPNKFEPIVKKEVKKQIVMQLGQGDFFDYSEQLEFDQALLSIRKSLEKEHPGELFLFHSPPIYERWHPGSESGRIAKSNETICSERNKPDQLNPNKTYNLDEAHQDLFIPRDNFDRLLASIKSRKNLILQGPPGTGKTFIARRLAWCLIGCKDNSPIEMVQFHQSYAYEDFVQGYRPTDSGGFELKKGVFHRFCERALANSDTPHVFIIDEINRGNLSRIFGELLMLIENDKRNEDFAVTLTYSDDRFHVPDNVYLLGLMNTADRSLALVDYALRRRFAFETLEPAYRPDYGRTAFEKYLTDRGANPELARRISDRMAELNESIRANQELGRGFQIGHSYFVPGKDETPSKDWYRNIIDTQIAPLLREYWFDSPEDVEKKVAKLTIDD